jgi:anti-sigma B factor antagonist
MSCRGSPEVLGSVTAERRGSWVVVTASGELDLGTVPALRSAGNEAIQLGDDQPRIAVNLTTVELIDSACLGLLIGLRRKVNQRDGRLVVLTNERIDQIFDATGTSSLFERTDTLPPFDNDRP